MNLLKNKWALAILILLVIGSVGIFFKDTLGPLFGGYEKSPRGYYFRFTQGQKLAKNMGPGYHIVFHYLLLGPNGDTVENKTLPGVEMQREYPVEANNELDDALQIAAPGSWVEILVPTDSLKLRTSSNIKVLAMESGKRAKFKIHVLKLLNDEAFAAYQNQRILERLKREYDLIDLYAAKNKKAWILDSLNTIKYVIDNKTDAPRLQDGDPIEFHTTIYNINGSLVVNSEMEGKKYMITVGKSTYQIRAFDAVLKYLAEGESGTFLVSSDYGFGSAGYQKLVAPYTPLIVQIKAIKKIKNK